MPKVATGELRIQAFGVTEPEAGTDTTSIRTTAAREGDHYVVDGRKIYIDNRDALDGEIERIFGRLTAEEVIEKLEEACIANARLRSVREFLDHPQLEARGRWHEVDSPSGPLHALLPPGLPSDTEPVMAPIPEVGEHTTTILSELGYDAGVLEE